MSYVLPGCYPTIHVTHGKHTSSGAEAGQTVNTHLDPTANLHNTLTTAPIDNT